jgi:hypothetical protein
VIFPFVDISSKGSVQILVADMVSRTVLPYISQHSKRGLEPANKLVGLLNEIVPGTLEEPKWSLCEEIQN